VSNAFRESPAHWRAIRLKQTVTACANGTWGEEPRGGPDDLICVRVADFDRQRLCLDLRNPTRRYVPPSYRRGRLLAPGDLLLEKSGGGDGQPVGAVMLYQGGEPAVCSNFIARMPVAPGFDARYLCYLHATLYRLGLNRRSIYQTTGIQNLDGKSYLQEVVRVPDCTEQRRIAAYLDHKTSLLDHLVETKRRLLELLRERREAVISQTMTQDADGWGTTRFKFVRSGALLYGANEPAADRSAEGPRYIRITDLKDDGSLCEDTFQTLPEHLAVPYLLEDGDLLLARSGATVGKAFRYREEWGRACFAGYLVRLRPDRRKILPDYLHYFTQSRAYRDQVRVHTLQATIANVSAERFGNFAVPLPSLDKQHAAVGFLDNATNCIDRLAAVTGHQLSLLRQYRSALIVAAVTRGL
jgi:type I restriction enzyme, S subunit